MVMGAIPTPSCCDARSMWIVRGSHWFVFNTAIEIGPDPKFLLEYDSDPTLSERCEHHESHGIQVFEFLFGPLHSYLLKIEICHNSVPHQNHLDSRKEVSQ